jgi:NAD(P)-dependent dehydrogenase (short-subunit alcohol dehydrogenase family)
VDGEKLTEIPAEILVDVHNASGIDGQGSRAAEDLAAQGFGIGVIDARDKVASATTIRHAPDRLEAARTLQASVPGSVLREDPARGERLDLTRGETYDGVEAIRVKAAKTGSGVGGSQPTTTAAQDICTG